MLFSLAEFGGKTGQNATTAFFGFFPFHFRCYWILTCFSSGVGGVEELFGPLFSPYNVLFSVSPRWTEQEHNHRVKNLGVFYVLTRFTYNVLHSVTKNNRASEEHNTVSPSRAGVARFALLVPFFYLIAPLLRRVMVVISTNLSALVCLFDVSLRPQPVPVHV